MSEDDPTYTSVLLPGSRVALFANDTQTVEAYKSLQSDWRFTRVQLSHYAGGVDEATRILQSGTAPDLMIIETETIDDSFTSRLEGLAALCPEGTAAIVIGPVNDVSLYRRLIGMGISEYLVRPIKAETLSFDIARSLIDRIGASGSRLVAVLGAKGGVGATAIAQALAWGAADIVKQKTMLLDAAGGWSTLSVGMNFEPATTLAEAARAAIGNNEDAFNRMIFQPHERLHVLSSGGDIMLEKIVEAGPYEGLIDKLMTTYPVVIVDLSQAPTELTRMVLSRAHEIMLVTTAMLPSLRSARSLMQEMKDIRADSDSRVDLVVNMVGMAAKQEVSKNDLEAALDRKPALHIPFDPHLFITSETEGRKLNASPEGDSVARNLLGVIKKILDSVGAENLGPANDDQNKKNKLSGILGKLNKK